MNGHELIARNEGGFFVLRVFLNRKATGEVVKSVSAQLILDHVAATWPHGTSIQWIVDGRDSESVPITLPRVDLSKLRELVALGI
jgi:hypothetical protein